MAGGDGSQALVASIAVEHDIPFVCVTAGTRNHFALDLGLDREDPRKSMYAFRDAVERHIDYATVNGRFFVNNVSLGVYATIVQQEGYRDAKVDTTGQLLPELLGQTEKPFDLEFTEPDGNEVDGAFLIQVSNNPYVLGASLDISQRRRIDTGKLGVFAVTAATGAEAAKLVTLSAIGQRNLSPNWHEFTTDVFEVRSRSGKAYVGVDGEALEMSTPLRCEIHPGGLRLYVPEGNLAVAEQRRARDISLSSVVSVARGVEPADA
jgi:diacylglycerol kinase family enzyme